ncbi:hypothetical protein ZTR_05667 [Talaromyces verruculosus]|nr:hypothetical protein ZTR_05667 [Talaromyces verruculosus]
MLKEKSATESHHSGTFDKLFHHKNRDEQNHDDENGVHSGYHDQLSGEARPQHESEVKRFENDFKKEENKFKKYLDKDEELEEEGKTYGGLM